MLGPNSFELGKSLKTKKTLLRAVKLRKILNLKILWHKAKQVCLKPKRTFTVKEKVTKDNFENISNEDKTNIRL